MSTSVGIVGLPNSGKSTLFNVLVKEKKALTAMTPFTTIAHNEGISSDIRFVDIAGLVKGSHSGQGFGNAFLEKIRGVDLILIVVRAFYSTMVGHPHKLHEPGSLEQVMEDIETIREELRVAGVHKPVIYVLNFDENKLVSGVVNEYLSRVEHKFSGPTVPICAKVEEQMIGLSPEELRLRFEELKVTETGAEKILKQVSLLLSEKSLN